MCFCKQCRTHRKSVSLPVRLCVHVSFYQDHTASQRRALTSDTRALMQGADEIGCCSSGTDHLGRG